MSSMALVVSWLQVPSEVPYSPTLFGILYKLISLESSITTKEPLGAAIFASWWSHGLPPRQHLSGRSDPRGMLPLPSASAPPPLERYPLVGEGSVAIMRSTKTTHAETKKCTCTEGVCHQQQTTQHTRNDIGVLAFRSSGCSPAGGKLHKVNRK